MHAPVSDCVMYQTPVLGCPLQIVAPQARQLAALRVKGPGLRESVGRIVQLPKPRHQSVELLREPPVATGRGRCKLLPALELPRCLCLSSLGKRERPALLEQGVLRGSESSMTSASP